MPHVAGCQTDASRNTNPNQHWVIEGNASQVQVQHLARENAKMLCLAPGDTATAGALLKLGPCGTSSDWQWHDEKGGRRSLRSAADTTLCLDAGSTAPAAAASCALPPLSALPYCNASLPPAARTADLLGRMSDREMVTLLHAEPWWRRAWAFDISSRHIYVHR